MIVVLTMASELDYGHDSLTHQCKSCARRFDSWDGLNTHRTLHCVEIDRDARTSAQEWTVDAVTDANGAPANRYYKLKWKGHPDPTRRGYQADTPSATTLYVSIPHVWV